MATSSHPRLPVRRGDQVVVITGEEEGRRGRVLAVYPARQRVLIEGINLVKRATRKTKDTKGGIVEREAPIHVSNVMPVTKWEERRNRRAAS